MLSVLMSVYHKEKQNISIKPWKVYGLTKL